MNADGSGLERVTYGEAFASFPMFSRDGAKLVFCGSRNGSAPRDLNVFMADWAAWASWITDYFGWVSGSRFLPWRCGLLGVTPQTEFIADIADAQELAVWRPMGVVTRAALEAAIVRGRPRRIGVQLHSARSGDPA